jgi:nucleotide-binding universal stress UspA family protein
MLSINRILLPVDFSERCLGATRYAEALAAHFHAEITLLHVLEPMRYEFSTLEFGGTVLNDLVANRASQARKQLDGFLAEELQRSRVKRVLLEGDPAQQIVQHAHDERIDVITMPTHGYGPFRRFILGSVTAKVLHDADCPVWTGVHMEEAPSAESISIRNVVCAVDLGPQSRKTLCWAAKIASEFDARLILAHAIPSIEARAGEYFDQDLTVQLSRSAREELEKLQHELAPQAEIFIEGGDAPKVVCTAAEHLNADLLVIGRGSAAGIFGRLRTNAYAIIRQSPCAVVSV